MSWFDRLLGLSGNSVHSGSQTSNIVNRESDFTAGFSDDELSRYALDKIYEECHVTALSSRWGDTMETVMHARERVRRAKEKYQDYVPIRLRRAIFRWLDFYDRRISEGERDIKSDARLAARLAELADLEKRSRHR